MSQLSSYPAIKDYALIGDCRTAALVSKGGSLDWLCLPRYDSPSIFAALLDRQKGGHFYIRPVGSYEVTRRYIPGTNVLETTFETSTGVVKLTDLMPVAGEEEKQLLFLPEREVLRKIECVSGRVDIEVAYQPRLNYARQTPRIYRQGNLGLVCEHRSQVLLLRSDIPLTVRSDKSGADGNITLEAGDRHYTSLTFTEGQPAVIPPLGDTAEAKVQRTTNWWRQWLAQCQYQGPYKEAVLRSALTLKLMTYAPSGAIVAAPTTSLPEQMGGVRNWDYRYCWLRDASLTLNALFELDFNAEGAAFIDWLLHTTWKTHPHLQVLYDIYGESRVPEKVLEHLEGYKQSRPVRIGNGARSQLQLDVYGEVVDAAYEYVARGGVLDTFEERMLVGIGEQVAKSWQKPDEGIWEVRSGRHHHTHSKVMCWVALDRLLRLNKEGILTVPEDEFAQERAKIRDAVEEHAYNEELQSYVSIFDGSEVDASLLLMPLHGYTQAGSPRMRSTIEQIEKQLGHNGLIYRYSHSVDDGLPPGEGAFGICSFWAITVKAMQGRREEAKTDFERILAYANDVGLLAEEIEPETGQALGNFPQAFTHIGLIHAALALEEPAAASTLPTHEAQDSISYPETS